MTTTNDRVTNDSGVRHEGSLIDERFELVSRIGQSDSGQVWRARDHDHDAAPCAVKLLHAHDDDLPRRASLLRALDHVSIAKHAGAGSWGEHDYLVSELVSGVSLRDILLARQPLPWKVVCRIGRDVARGIAHARAAGLPHGNLKPGNIMVVDAGSRGLVLDFGMAPRRHDGVALGAVLYEGLTGTAHEPSSPRPTVRVPSLPAAVDDVVARLLDGDEADRSDDEIGAVALQLEEVLADVAPVRPRESHDGWQLLAKCPFADVHEHASRRVVRLRRNALEFAGAEDVAELFWVLRTAMPLDRRDGFALLTDMREGPMRTDPRYEQLVVAELSQWLMGWSRVVALFSTSLGVQQAQRFAAVVGLQVYATTHAADAEAHLDRPD